MKKIELSEEIKAVFGIIVIIAGLTGLELLYIAHEGKGRIKAERKEKYNSLEILKYSGDTLEFVFHNRSVQYEFNQEWEKYNSGRSIQQNPVGQNMSVLKYNGDTLQIKFTNAETQRQFEKQWRKYSDYKLNHINANIKGKKR